MRIGLMMPDALPVEAQVQQVLDCERDGFDSAWFGQVFATDAMTVIALAAERTSRIELGTSVVPTYARHPFVMAQQAATVQAVAGGRFTLGIGLSHKPVIENMWGLSYDRPAKHMREYLSVLVPLLTDGRVVFKGDEYNVAAGLQVTGGSPTPVLIAALAPRMLEICGTMTAGTVTWMTGAKTIEKHVAPRLNDAASRAGRPAPRIAVGLPVAVTNDAAGARERAAKIFQVYGQLPNYRRMLDIEGAPGPADVAICGDEATVEREVRAVAASGATDFFAAMFPVGEDAKASLARTRELMRGLVGKV
jgi:F420-dependent oxidoreductase-like protein